MDSKPVFQSKTLVFNLLALATLVASAYGYGSFEPSPEVGAIAPVIIIVGNLLLRLVTKQAVTLRGTAEGSLAEPAPEGPSALPNLLGAYRPLEQWATVRCDSCKALTAVGTALTAPHHYTRDQIGLSHCVVCGSSSVQAV